MPDIASVLKSEIARLARKELRAETESLKRAVSAYRSEIAALKRRMAVLERQARRSAKASISQSASEPNEEDVRLRFSPKGFAKHRQRLGLSAADYGALLGVSALSVYKWEAGQGRPRDRYLPVIAAVRKLGKREAALRLQEQV
jgi:DNA-binding transcriptional regulator YiaG